MIFTYTATDGTNGKVRAATPLRAARKVIGALAELVGADVATGRSTFKATKRKDGKTVECALIEVKEVFSAQKPPLWFVLLIAFLGFLCIAGIFISLAGYFDYR